MSVFGYALRSPRELQLERELEAALMRAVEAGVREAMMTDRFRTAEAERLLLQNKLMDMLGADAQPAPVAGPMPTYEPKREIDPTELGMTVEQAREHYLNEGMARYGNRLPSAKRYMEFRMAALEHQLPTAAEAAEVGRAVSSMMEAVHEGAGS